MDEKQVIIAQLFGFVSLAFGIASLWQKNDLRLKQFMCGLNLSHSLHFFLLGAYPAMIASIVSALRTLCSLRYRSSYIALAFIVLNIGLSWPHLHALRDYFPLLGASIGTYAILSLTGLPMRIALFCGGCCWLINNVLVGSIGGTLLETLLMSINLKTMLQLRRDALAVLVVK